MTALYLFPLVTWLAEVCFMIPAVWSIYVRQTRHGDQARLVCLLFGLLMLAFLARRVATREPVDHSMAALLLASSGVGLFTIAAAVNYGRGGRV